MSDKYIWESMQHPLKAAQYLVNILGKEAALVYVCDSILYAKNTEEKEFINRVIIELQKF